MAKVQNLSALNPNLPFTEYDFYDFYHRSFEYSEPRQMKVLLRMTEAFGLVARVKTTKRGGKPYFTPKRKVALMFLKMHT